MATVNGDKPVYDNFLYLTVDVALFALVDGETHVLMIRRAADSDAFPGRWAFPGGYVDAGERIEDAARRELAEETGLTAPATWERIGMYDDPDRDPRDRVVTVPFAAVLPHPVLPQAGDDAADAAWLPVAELLDQPGRLAFDHEQILIDAYDRMAPALDAALDAPTRR